MGSDPELKYLDTGNCVLSFSLAVNKGMSPAARGMGEASDVDWIRIDAWGRTAENLAQSARKGNKLMVFGALTTNSWTDKYGQNRNDLKVKTRSVFFPSITVQCLNYLTFTMLIVSSS